MKAALGHADPLLFNGLRYPLAAALLWVLLRRRGALILPEPADRARVLGLGLLGHVAYQMTFIYGVDATLAGNASLLLATVPAWTVLLSTAAGHERVGGGVVFGVAATLLGMVLVVLGGGSAVGVGGASLAGDLLMVGSAVLWSLYTVGARGLARRYGPLSTAAWTLWVGTPFLVAAALPGLLRPGGLALPWWVWGAVVYAGVLSLAVAYVLWYRGVAVLGSARTAVFSNLVPVWALLAAWLFLGEVPGWLQLAGAAAVLAGVTAARRSRAPQAPEPEPSSLRWRTSGNS